MSYKPQLLDVADGGTGVSSNTAYAILCGGTTATNPIQSIASVGTTGQLLTSNGAGALPTFQDQEGNIALILWTGPASNPADGTTYYYSFQGGFNTNTVDGSTRINIPKDGTLVSVYGNVWVGGTLATADNVSMYARINNSTDVTITTTSQWTAVNNSFSVTGLSTALSEGDFIQLKIVTPTWTTNPTTVKIATTFNMTYGF